MDKYLDDILFVAGGLMIVGGCYLVLPVLALFAGGAMLIGLGVMVGSEERKAK